MLGLVFVLKLSVVFERFAPFAQRIQWLGSGLLLLSNSLVLRLYILGMTGEQPEVVKKSCEVGCQVSCEVCCEVPLAVRFLVRFPKCIVCRVGMFEVK